MKFDNEVKFSSEAPTTISGGSNKYGDVGFESGGCADYCNVYKDPYSVNTKVDVGIPFNVKLGIGLAAIGAVTILYKPGSAAKLVKTASETSSKASKADLGSVAAQMRKKVKDQTESIKLDKDAPPSPPPKQNIMDKIKITMKTKDGEKIKIKAQSFGIDMDKLKKEMSNMDKSMKENMAKHQPAADEQKKQINEAIGKMTEDINKYFADMKKQKISEKTPVSNGPPGKEEKLGAKDTNPEEPSFISKLLKESGIDNMFDKHEAGGFEQVNDKKGMSLQEARRILQFDASNPNIKKEEIVSNFRKVSRANHPDLGGSPYVAAKINEAREALLKHNKKTQRRR